MMNRLRGALSVVASLSVVVACGGSALESSPEPDTAAPLTSELVSWDAGFPHQLDAGIAIELVPCDCKSHSDCGSGQCLPPQGIGGGQARCDDLSAGNTGQCR